MQPGQNHVWEPGKQEGPRKVSFQFYQRIRLAAVLAAEAGGYDVTEDTDDSDIHESDEDMDDDNDDGQSRFELDSHANMPVVGDNAYIIADTGKWVEVSPFSPDYEPIRVKLVDAAVLYEDPYNGEEYILVLRNVLYVSVCFFPGTKSALQMANVF